MTENECGKLGLIDWGIGGIGVYRAVKAAFPAVGITYFSDTGAIPYGKMKRHELSKRLDSVIAFLKNIGVTHVVIACNAASTAIADLTTQHIKVEGVIAPAVELTATMNPRKLGLIGGGRTVLSGVYRNAFAKSDISLTQRIAQPLSGLIESGDISSQTLRSECATILAPLKNCSHILLACTHYPAISNIIADFVSPTTVLIDPAEAVVARLKKWHLSNGADEFFTTGDATAMKSSAQNAFGVSIDKVQVTYIASDSTSPRPTKNR